MNLRVLAEVYFAFLLWQSRVARIAQDVLVRDLVGILVALRVRAFVIF
jgi:hypothetical protein